jgi:hypothetical protein
MKVIAARLIALGLTLGSGFLQLSNSPSEIGISLALLSTGLIILISPSFTECRRTQQTRLEIIEEEEI